MYLIYNKSVKFNNNKFYEETKTIFYITIYLESHLVINHQNNNIFLSIIVLSIIFLFFKIY